MDERLKSILKRCAIKSEVKTSLKECLELTSLVDLKNIAEEYELSGISNAKKDKIVPLLWKAITESLLKNYTYFIEFQEEGFKNLISQKVVEDVNDFYIINSLLFEIGIAFYFYNNDNFYLSIPTELVEIYNSANLEELNKTKAKNQEIHKYIIALCNLYGIYDSTQFIAVYNMHHEEKLMEREFVSYAEMMNFKQKYFSVDNESKEYCLVFIGEDEDGELYEVLCRNVSRPYYMPSKEEIDFFAVECYENTPQFQKFEKYVKSNKLVKRNKMEEFLDMIRIDCQDDKRPSEIIETLINYGIVFKGLEDTSEIMNLIIEMSNHERKFALKGYSPVMLREAMNKPKLDRNQLFPPQVVVKKKKNVILPIKARNH